MNTKTLLLAVVVLASGCATNNHYLGETTTLTPGWSALKNATIEAFTDPNVWAPTLAAVALQINDLDEQISDELYENNPVFGNVENAKDWSDNFRNYTTLSYASTAIAAPGPDSTAAWLGTKVIVLGSQWVSVEIVDEFRREIQHRTERTRPDESNNFGFPSGHTTTAAYQAQLAEINIKHLEVSKETKRNLNLTVNGFAAAAGYARVEAGRHYPSDVLVGWALGNFFGHYANAFIDPKHNLVVMPQIDKETAGVALSYNF